MASAKLSRTPSSASNRKTWTWSGWIKRSKLGGGNQVLFEALDGSFPEKLQFTADDLLEYDHDIAGTDYTVNTVVNFRDVNAWYHIVWAKDTTQATETDRIKLWVNGTQISLSESQLGYPPQNYDGAINKNIAHYIGANDSSEYFDGIMAHVNFVDGTALTPTSFGETDATTGIWKPKTAPSVTYGTNGFFLKFDNSGNMGLDSAGSNNYTTSGTIIQTKDTPSNVFATMNPIDSYWMSATYSHTNNRVVTQGSHRTSMAATLGASSGKYYWEVKVVDNTGSIMVGIDTKGASTCTTFSSGQCLEYTGQRTYGWGYDSSNGQVYNNDSSATYGNTYTANDIIGVALDLDNNKLYFAKNGTWQNSGDPTSGSTGTGAVSITAASSTDTGFYFPACSDTSSSTAVTYSTNFGNGYLGGTAVTSAQSPSDGIGIFEYSVPSGYKALCTKSINAQEYS